MSRTHPSFESVSRMLGVTVDRLRLELDAAVRRSEPDAREVSAVVRGKRLVGRQEQDGEWKVSVADGKPGWEAGPPITVVP